MKNTSKKAYNKGQIEFWTHRNIITEAMKDGVKRTYKEIAIKVRLREEQVWKRVSELEADGTLIAVGTIEVNGNPNTLYQINTDGRKSTKKPQFKAWCKKKWPQAIYEYDLLFNHEL